MILIYSVILSLFFDTGSSQLQCVKETPNDSEFSINVTGHIDVESGDCIWIRYEFTFPTNKITVPYKKIWFQRDPQKTVNVETVTNINSQTTDTFMINGLPQGEYEYGFKLEWECNKTYIFPKRVRISVSELTRRPSVWTDPMTAGQPARLTCNAVRLCRTRPDINWEQTKADGHSIMMRGDYFGFPYHFGRDTLRLTPTVDDHNTNITCVADYGHSAVKTTVTLTVEFPPKIINSSQCTIEGKLLVCVCVSQGNPPSPITWPSATLTDFSVTSSSSILTVNSHITMPAAVVHNTSVKCISSNKLGQAETEILIQNNTKNLKLNYGSSDAVLPWIIAAVSISLNLVLLTSLIICTYKHRRKKSQQKELHEEINTYASLNQADIEQDYSVISPRSRGVSNEHHGRARDHR